MSKETKEALAYALAKDAHDGQMYGNKPYFDYHVLGVANEFSPKCKIYGNGGRYKCIKCGHWDYNIDEDTLCEAYDSDAYIVALLHDVVDDSNVTVSLIADLFGMLIFESVLLLTKQSDQTYRGYIEEISTNNYAKKVKIADLKLNLSQPDTKPSLVKRYTEALEVLEGL